MNQREFQISLHSCHQMLLTRMTKYCVPSRQHSLSRDNGNFVGSAPYTEIHSLCQIPRYIHCNISPRGYGNLGDLSRIHIFKYSPIKCGVFYPHLEKCTYCVLANVISPTFGNVFVLRLKIYFSHIGKCISPTLGNVFLPHWEMYFSYITGCP